MWSNVRRSVAPLLDRRTAQRIVVAISGGKKRCESINLMFLQSGISDPSEKRQILRLMKLASHNFGENLRDQAGLTAPLPLRVAVRRTATPITAAALRVLCSHPPQTAQCSRHSRHGWRVVRVLSDSL